MSQSKSKFWYSNNCLHLSKRAVPLASINSLDWGIYQILYLHYLNVDKLTYKWTQKARVFVS
jgi:hypothetical protein